MCETNSLVLFLLSLRSPRHTSVPYKCLLQIIDRLNRVQELGSDLMCLNFRTVYRLDDMSRLYVRFKSGANRASET